jgi:cold shock CspA family protein
MPVGAVTAFDERRGIGVVTAGGRRYSFHCTRIADGSRTVRVGSAVEFTVAPGRLGDWEAVDLVELDGARNA